MLFKHFALIWAVCVGPLVSDSSRLEHPQAPGASLTASVMAPHGYFQLGACYDTVMEHGLK